jgi:hypothetical protein
LVVEAVYSTGLREIIPNADLTITGFNKDVAALHEVTLAWGGMTVTFEAHVGIIPERITVEALPTRRFYTVREPLDRTGMRIMAHYTGGNTEIVTVGISTSMDIPITFAGPKTVTITYMGRTATIPNNINGIVYFGSNALRDFAIHVAGLTGGGSSGAALNISLPAAITGFSNALSKYTRKPSN